MLDTLQNPVLLAAIVVILLVLIAIPLIRRRRAGRDDILPPPDLGQPIDYTSIPIEEPTTLGDRFRQASPFAKLLVVLLPLLVIIGGAVLFQTFLSSPGTTTEAPTPAGPPPTITNVTANVAGRGKISVKADTTLPDGTPVRATMREGEQEFTWFNAEKATATATAGKIELIMERAEGALPPKRDLGQMVVLSATGPGDQAVTSDPVQVAVPSLYEADYYQLAVEPTAVPTEAPTATPEPTAEVTEPTPEPTDTPAVALTATVFNGGNIRRLPQVTNNPEDILGQLHAGEVVELLERSVNGQWYRVKAPEAEGWVSQTLLTVDAQIAEQVPRTTPASTGLTATVFNGGNVRERPVTGRPLDQINAGETVELLAKTADGGWYQITNIRGITGWVSRTLLTIDGSVADQVPVAP